jgi:hypothetical protein
MTLVEQISAVELVKVRYRLTLLEPFHFEPEMILHWRKELLRGARQAVESGADSLLLNALLDPRPAADPYAQKKFQKPSPSFVIDPVNLRAGDYAAGELLSLEVLFPGDGVGHAVTFARLLIGLGSIGLFKGAGRFELDSIWSMYRRDGWQAVWTKGDSLGSVSMPILNVQWLIEEEKVESHPLLLRFVSPARLLQKNRPLFKAEFSDLFPFVLRRVTSLLYSCCQLELDLDITDLINQAHTVSTYSNRLTWQDWRHLDADHGIQGVGGVAGSVEITAGLTDDLHTFLCLAELFNIGKGASYGAGRFVLESAR